MPSHITAANENFLLNNLNSLLAAKQGLMWSQYFLVEENQTSQFASLQQTWNDVNLKLQELTWQLYQVDAESDSKVSSSLSPGVLLSSFAHLSRSPASPPDSVIRAIPRCNIVSQIEVFKYFSLSITLNFLTSPVTTRKIES